MTSATDTNEHPEVEEISALTEGILTADRSAAVRGHLVGCPPCAEVRRSLEEVRALLGGLPGPGPMPAGIAARIDAALAAEVAVGESTPSPAQQADLARQGGQHVSGRPAPGRPGPDRPGASHRSPQSPESERTAAQPHARPVARTDVSRETSHAPRHPAGPATAGPGRDRRRRRWTRALITACSAAILAGGTFAVLSHASKGSGSPVAAATQPATFSGVGLSLRVHQLLLSASPQAGARTGAGGPMHLDIAGLPLCVLQATHRDEQPLATAQGRYGDRDAYLLVLPHPADPGSVDAYVVDASCTAAQPPVPGRLLAQATYRRG